MLPILRVVNLQVLHYSKCRNFVDPVPYCIKYIYIATDLELCPAGGGRSRDRCGGRGRRRGRRRGILGRCGGGGRRGRVLGRLGCSQLCHSHCRAPSVRDTATPLAGGGHLIPTGHQLDPVRIPVSEQSQINYMYILYMYISEGKNNLKSTTCTVHVRIYVYLRVNILKPTTSTYMYISEGKQFQMYMYVHVHVHVYLRVNSLKSTTCTYIHVYVTIH